MEFMSSFLTNNSMLFTYLTYNFNFPDYINVPFSSIAIIMFSIVEIKDESIKTPSLCF